LGIAIDQIFSTESMVYYKYCVFHLMGLGWRHLEPIANKSCRLLLSATSRSLVNHMLGKAVWRMWKEHEL
jgi:hypothetical protein